MKADLLVHKRHVVALPGSTHQMIRAIIRTDIESPVQDDTQALSVLLQAKFSEPAKN